MFGWIRKIFRTNANHSSNTVSSKKKIPKAPENFTFKELDFQVHSMVNFSEKDKALFLKAMEVGKTVLNSQEFYDWMCKQTFAENHGLSGKQIWELMVTGKDMYNENDDYDIDVFITMYSNYSSSVIGYTYTGSFKTWINKKFFRDVPGVLSNVVHEALHNFGFSHYVKKTWYQSVPYAVGYFVEDLAVEVMKGKTLTPYKAAA